MGDKIDINESFGETMKDMATVVRCTSGSTYYYFPFWFKIDVEETVLAEVITMEKLPEELKDFIEDKRGTKKEQDENNETKGN